ncbi:hypothetical protein D9599_29705 [Roseomonas sp. KE2513]|uniref:dihydrodipicolinate synthase family protein n=1 Tax=Roseomonas sp. KE2513 TaxID=2479202 RepID=UPI0018DFED5F|nr:dihydrodipicolinate synthase family protein [Roseomonas sp. KE2513]MBI0539678.1 hypothetical protein [Roseomonas sp. KE2513]
MRSDSSAKDWARAQMRGVGNILLPSFTPDFRALDEGGIRHDVRQSIAHGFFGSSCSTPGLTVAETGRFLEVACDEAAGRYAIGAILERPNLEEQIEVLRWAERAGCSHAFIVLPRGVRPQSDDELYDWYLRLIGDSPMRFVLYGHDNRALRGLHPSGLPLAVYDRLADLPQVVAVKLTQPINSVLAMQCCETVGDRLVVNPVNLDLIPVLARSYPIQVTADWIVESVQSPERPLAVEFMREILAGRMDAALRCYWEVQPAVREIFTLQASLVAVGGHPWQHMKYFQWATGGNGGLSRDLEESDVVPILDAAARQRINDTYRHIGIMPSDAPEDSFLVGRNLYAQGVRPDDLAARPQYA